MKKNGFEIVYKRFLFSALAVTALIMAVTACGKHTDQQTQLPVLKNDAISSMSAVVSDQKAVATVAVITSKAAVKPQKVQQTSKSGVLEGGGSTYAGDEAILNEIDQELDGLLNDLNDSKQEDAGLVVNQTP